jgi:hypothetical protein
MMKRTVIVRPNLKLIFVGALLVIVVQHLIITGLSQGSAAAPFPIHARDVNSDDLHKLIRHAVENPTADAYLLLSACFEKRGDYRKALMYLRRADQLREAEDIPE